MEDIKPSVVLLSMCFFFCFYTKFGTMVPVYYTTQMPPPPPQIGNFRFSSLLILKMLFMKKQIIYSNI